MSYKIRIRDNSLSTGSRSENIDDDYTGVKSGTDSLSTGSQVADSDDPANEYVRIRHVRADRAREKVRSQSRAVRREREDHDDIEPSDSASRPDTSRQSSSRRISVHSGREASRPRAAAPEPPPIHPPRRNTGPRIPQEPLQTEGLRRPDSYTTESLEYDDYPPQGGAGYGGYYSRSGAPHWGPRYDPYEESSVVSQPLGALDPMEYRDPYYDDLNPFTTRPMADYYDARPPPRPRPVNNRYSAGPADYALMRYPSRETYDPYYYQRRMPYRPEMREPPPPMRPETVKIPPAGIPLATPSPSDVRLERLEEMMTRQAKANELREEAKLARRLEEERKKKMAEELSHTEKLAALEKLMLKQAEETLEREKKREAAQKAADDTALARLMREQNEKAAKEKIDKELKDAAAKAKTAAEAEAATKAAEAKAKADKELAELKEKHEAAEKAQKKAEEEAEKLKPKKADPPVRFKDAVGRKFSFPYEVCKTWKGMETLIKQAFVHVDVIGRHVMEGHYDLHGPDGEIILPQVWETMIKPDYYIEMLMWPIPELEKKAHPHPGMQGIPGGLPPGARLPTIEELMKGMPGGGGGKGKGKSGKSSKSARGTGMPFMMPAGPLPPPPGGPISAMPNLPPGLIPPPGMNPMMAGALGGGNPAMLAAAMAKAQAEEKKGKKKGKQAAGIASWFAGGTGGSKKR